MDSNNQNVNKNIRKFNKRSDINHDAKIHSNDKKVNQGKQDFKSGIQSKYQQSKSQSKELISKQSFQNQARMGNKQNRQSSEYSSYNDINSFNSSYSKDDDNVDLSRRSKPRDWKDKQKQKKNQSKLDIGLDINVELLDLNLDKVQKQQEWEQKRGKGKKNKNKIKGKKKKCFDDYDEYNDYGDSDSYENDGWN